MKFKFIGEIPINIGMLGNVKPGDEFDINNEEYLPIFIGNPLFEEVKEKIEVVEEVKEE